MSKTVGSILAALGAVAFVVGVVFTAGGLLAGLTLAGATGFGIGVSASTLFLVSAGLTAAGSLLGGQASPRPESTETAIKTPRPPRVSSYGRRRLYGSGYWLFETASDGTAVDVYPIHDGKMSSVVQFYLNDDPVTLTGCIGPTELTPVRRCRRCRPRYRVGAGAEMGWSCLG